MLHQVFAHVVFPIQVVWRFAVCVQSKMHLRSNIATDRVAEKAILALSEHSLDLNSIVLGKKLPPMPHFLGGFSRYVCK